MDSAGSFGSSVGDTGRAKASFIGESTAAQTQTTACLSAIPEAAPITALGAKAA